MVLLLALKMGDGVMSNKYEECNFRRWEKQGNRFSPRVSQWKYGPADTGFGPVKLTSDFWLPNCNRINFHCFEPQSLWYLLQQQQKTNTHTHINPYIHLYICICIIIVKIK